MARQKGTANFSGNLEVLASAPLDARTKVATKADLTASGQFPYPFVGMETYVVAENKKYRLIADDPTVLANWEEVGSGSGLPSGGTQGQVLTKQSATDSDADWDNIPHDNTKANSSSLAPVETSTTSEHAYEIGDHLMLAGGRFLVTADIAVGDTLDVSTNIQAVNLEDETGLDASDFADIITPLPGKFMGGLNYSTEEQVVGTWIDGKPIYQKTVIINSSYSVEKNQRTSITVPFSSTNTLSIVSIEGRIRDSAWHNYYPLPGFKTSGAGTVAYFISVFMTDTGVNIQLGGISESFSTDYISVTAKYTKTTDPTP